MDTDKGAEPTEQVVATPAETPVVTQPAQEKTYTQKELDAILAAEKEREEARVKGLNKVVSRKDSEIEALKKQPGDAVTLPVLRKMAAALEEAISDGYGSEERSQSAKLKLAAINQEITQMATNAERAKTEAIRDNMWAKIKELGLNPDTSAEDYDERLDPIVQFWKLGDIPEAQRRLDKLASKIEKERQKVAEVETPKVDVAKLEAEIRAKVIKELGLDKQDVGGGAGGVTSFTREQIRNMSSDEYARNEPAIRKALEAGRIK